MPFVKRNERGEIVAVSQLGEAGFSEELASDDGQMIGFLNQLSTGEPSLHSTDQDFIRVLEDVVELLIDKGVILFTDLPDSAQDKMMHRQRLRSELGGNLNLIGDD